MLSFFNKQKNVFIHIPKTGGSSFIGLLKDSLSVSEAEKGIPSHVTLNVKNVEISHIDFNDPDRKFKRPELIISSDQVKRGKNYRYFMLVRNPVDRILSEFNFQYHILDGKSGNKSAAILSKLPKKPSNLDEYVQNPHVQNYQVKFLLGRPLADPTPVEEADFKKIVNAIEKLPIHCGCTDQYSSFLQVFQRETGYQLNERILVRKKTPEILKKPIAEKLMLKIESLNEFDRRLYDLVRSQLDENVAGDYFTFDDPEKFIV